MEKKSGCLFKEGKICGEHQTCLQMFKRLLHTWQRKSSVLSHKMKLFQSSVRQKRAFLIIISWSGLSLKQVNLCSLEVSKYRLHNLSSEVLSSVIFPLDVESALTLGFSMLQTGCNPTKTSLPLREVITLYKRKS